MSSYVPAPLRRVVIERAANLCEYCLIHDDDTFVGCQIEHIIAEKHGGATNEANLALACAFCNRAKGTDIATLVPTTGILCRLFNPRTDSWSHHFHLNRARIEGITDIGICTAALLAFNEEDRIIEREALAEVDRYPSAAALRRMNMQPRP